MKKYILVDGEPVEETNFLAWAEWFSVANRVVAFSEIGNSKVSTVFLGLDHSFLGGKPLLFETLVFGGRLDEEMERYSTLEEAMIGHERMVGRVQRESVP